MAMRPFAAATMLIVALAVAPGCQRDVGPEDEVRAWIRGVIEAAERRDVGDLRSLIASDYADGRGNDKTALVNYCRFLILQHQTLRVFADVEQIELLSPVWARATLRAALAGREVEQAWWETQADFYRFELELVAADGEWRLIRADWARSADR